MATQVKHRRGTQSEIDAFTGAIAEIVVNTSANELVLNDGATIGGIPLPKKRNTHLSYDTLVDALNDKSLKSGYSVGVKERTAGNGGAGEWDVVLTSSVTPNDDNILVSVAVPTLSLKFRQRIEGVIVVDSEYRGLRECLQNCPANSTLLLGVKDYDITDLYFLDGIALDPSQWRGNLTKNLRIIGSKMPEYADDGTRFVSGSGTVVQGMILNWADGFECYNLGVDCGSYVVDTLNGGVYLDGFVPGTLRTLTEQADQPEFYIKNIHFGNIKTLLKDPVNGQPETYKHSILLEHVFTGSYDGVIECKGGYFGFVNKSQHIQGNSIPFLHGQLFGATYIHKSDQWSESKHNALAGYKVGREQDAQVPACLWEAQSGTQLSDYTVDSITGVNCKELFAPATSATERMTDISIGKIQGGLMSGANGCYISGLFDRVSIGTHDFSQCVNGIITDAGCTQVDIGSGKVRIASVHGYNLAGDVTHGNISGYEVTQWTVFNNGYVPNPELITNDGSGNGVLSSLFTVGVAFEGNWASSGFYPLIVNAWGGKLSFRGFVSSPTNTGNGVLFTLPVNLRPKRQEIFFTDMFIGGAWESGFTVAFNTDGTVVCDPGAVNVTDVAMTGIELRYNI